MKTTDSLLRCYDFMGQIIHGFHLVGIVTVRTDLKPFLRFLSQYPAGIEPIVFLSVDFSITVKLHFELGRFFDLLFRDEIQISKFSEHGDFTQIDIAGHSFNISSHLYRIVRDLDIGHLTRIVLL